MKSLFSSMILSVLLLLCCTLFSTSSSSSSPFSASSSFFFVRCDFYNFDVVISPEQPLIAVAPMYSSSLTDADTADLLFHPFPFKGPAFGDGHSFIDINIDFINTNNASAAPTTPPPSSPTEPRPTDATTTAIPTASVLPPFLNVVLLAASDLSEIGYTNPGAGKTFFCCSYNVNFGSSDIIQGCLGDPDYGTLVVRAPPDRARAFRVPTNQSSSSSPTASFRARFDINERNNMSTTNYVLIIGYCRSYPAVYHIDNIGHVVSSLRITGMTHWHNPFGELPARKYDSFLFNGYNMIVCTCVAIAWFIQYIRYRSAVTMIQNFVSVILLVFTAEIVAAFMDDYNWNVNGVRNASNLLAYEFLSATRLTLCRVLLVIVALGYKVTTPVLGCTEDPHSDLNSDSDLSASAVARRCYRRFVSCSCCSFVVCRPNIVWSALIGCASVYWLASFLFMYESNASTTTTVMTAEAAHAGRLSTVEASFAEAVMMVMEFVFWLWIAAAFTRTVTNLTKAIEENDNQVHNSNSNSTNTDASSRKNNLIHKRSNYTRLATMIVIAWLTTTVFMAINNAWSNTAGRVVNWRYVWLVDCFPPFMYTLMLTMVMMMWKPSSDSRQLNEYMELSMEFTQVDGEDQSMTIAHGHELGHEDEK